MHKLKLTKSTAKTECGLKIWAFYPMSQQALVVGEERKVDCTTDAAKVTCDRCKFEMGHEIKF